MRSNTAFDVVYTHTEGEPTCIIHSGIFYPPRSSILEKRRFLEENYDWLRTALMREPRGHKDMFGVFLTPASEPGFDAGLIWIDGTQYSNWNRQIFEEMREGGVAAVVQAVNRKIGAPTRRCEVLDSAISTRRRQPADAR